MSDEKESFECPNCSAELTREDILSIMFSNATVLACPVCKKTISLQPSDF